jgi:hypothetical protein
MPLCVDKNFSLYSTFIAATIFLNLWDISVKDGLSVGSQAQLASINDFHSGSHQEGIWGRRSWFTTPSTQNRMIIKSAGVVNSKHEYFTTDAWLILTSIKDNRRKNLFWIKYSASRGWAWLLFCFRDFRFHTYNGKTERG